jgi:hypothetical protein
VGFLVAVFALVMGAGKIQAGIITIDLLKAPMNTAGGAKSTGMYDLASIYSVPGGFGVSFLIPPLPLDAPRWGDSVAGLFNPKEVADKG